MPLTYGHPCCPPLVKAVEAFVDPPSRLPMNPTRKPVVPDPQNGRRVTMFSMLTISTTVADGVAEVVVKRSRTVTELHSPRLLYR